MNVFVDIGCYDGDTVEQFRNWRRLAFPDKQDWTIHAFDPNPEFQSRWAIVKDDSTYFHLEAAWTENGEREFAIEDSSTPFGSTLMEGKRKVWEQNKHIKVHTFDFSDWLKQFKTDYVIVKMDAEGAEFPILNKMIMDGTITIPDKLLVEFHPNKVQEYTTLDKNRLIDTIQSLGTDILEWH